MDMNMIFTTILTGIGSLAGYLFGRRKNEAETDKLVLENVKDVLKIYSDVIEDLKEQVNELRVKILDYEATIGKLTREVNTLRSDFKKSSKDEKS